MRTKHTEKQYRAVNNKSWEISTNTRGREKVIREQCTHVIEGRYAHGKHICHSISLTYIGSSNTQYSDKRIAHLVLGTSNLSL